MHMRHFCNFRTCPGCSVKGAHFSALDGQQLLVVEGSGLAGDAGSLLPGVLPLQLSACVGVYRQRHSSYIPSAPQPQPHNHHNHHNHNHHHHHHHHHHHNHNHNNHHNHHHHHNHHNHHQASRSECRSHQWVSTVFCSVALAVDMLLHGERDSGAAKRRRERRLRSWLKHTSGRPCVWLWLRHSTTPPGQLTFEARHEGGGGCQERRLTRPEDSHQSRKGEVREEHQALRGQTRLPPGDAASTSRRGAAAGACGAALRGAYGRACTVGANSGCSCAAVGGTVGGHLQHLQAN